MEAPSNIFSDRAQSRSSIYMQMQSFYVGKVKELFQFLHKKKWSFLASAIATLLIEPCNTFRAAYLMHRGLESKKFTSLNPKFLSNEQINRAPVLLIHGDSSNSGLFALMIDRITQEDPHRPIFTVDLISPDGIVSAKNHLVPLMAKVKEIKALYPPFKCPKLHLVGHSSGGDVLGPLVKMMLKEEASLLPGAIIKIGSIFKKNEAQEFIHDLYGNVLEIVGTKDVFEGDNSHVPNKLVVVSGHLGLLFNERVLKRISREINLSERLKPVEAAVLNSGGILVNAS